MTVESTTGLSNQKTTQGSIPPGPLPDSKRRWGIVVLGTLGFIISLFYRVSLTVISPTLSQELGLSSAQLGFAAASFFYAFSFSQLPLGVALDRLGTRLTRTGLGLLGVAGALLFASAQGQTQLVLARVLLGVGMSCNLMGPLTLFAAWFPLNRFGLVSGILFAMGSLGTLLAATPLAWLTQNVGWRNSFVFFAALNLLQVAALWLVVRDHPPGFTPGPQGEKGSWRGILEFYGSYSFWALSLGTFTRYGFFVALQGLWAGPFLIYGLGLDLITTGNALLCLSLGAMAGQPFSGWLSDQVLRSRKHVVWPSLWLFALMTISMTLWSSDTPVWFIMLGFAALGVASAPGNIIYAHIKELVPPEMTARAMTSVNLFTMLGAAAFTQILGFLVAENPSRISDPAEFNNVWLLGASALTLAGLAYFFSKEKQALRRLPKK